MSTVIRSNNYEIFLGNDTFYQVGKFLSRNPAHHERKKFILTDANTREHCLPLLQQGVLALKDATVLEIPAGEQSKSIDVVAGLWNELTGNGADRHALLVNLGGGVVTDVGGFTAATFMRGIDFINIPTTLLAMVDASVGGKNGINFAGYKNHVGTFDEPRAVFASPVFLKTLPSNELRCGFAEVIKHALLAGSKKWSDVREITSLESVSWYEIIKESIWTKNKIVNSDYRDKHLRKALNFGHTIGHALESYSQKNHAVPLKHGEAIAIGMIGETFLSKQCCGLKESDAQEIYQLIRRHYPPAADFSAQEVFEFMKGDKKNFSEQISFALLRNIGEPAINQHPDPSLIHQALEFCKEKSAVVN